MHQDLSRSLTTFILPRTFTDVSCHETNELRTEWHHIKLFYSFYSNFYYFLGYCMAGRGRERWFEIQKALGNILLDLHRHGDTAHTFDGSNEPQEVWDYLKRKIHVAKILMECHVRLFHWQSQYCPVHLFLSDDKIYRIMKLFRQCHGKWSIITLKETV